jgi:hypothetical protein
MFIHGEIFTISLGMLCLDSPEFAQQNGLPDRIRTDVPRSSVIASLRPFQLSDPERNRANGSDLLTGCFKFDANSLRTEVKAFLTNNGRSGPDRTIGRS